MKKYEEWTEESKNDLVSNFEGEDTRSIQTITKLILKVIEISQKENNK